MTPTFAQIKKLILQPYYKMEENKFLGGAPGRREEKPDMNLDDLAGEVAREILDLFKKKR